MGKQNLWDFSSFSILEKTNHYKKVLFKFISNNIIPKKWIFFHASTISCDLKWIISKINGFMNDKIMKTQICQSVALNKKLGRLWEQTRQSRSGKCDWIFCEENGNDTSWSCIRSKENSFTPLQMLLLLLSSYIPTISAPHLSFGC